MARHRCKSTTIDSEAHAEPTNLHALEHLHNYLINPPKKDDDAGDFLSDFSEDNQETSPLLNSDFTTNPEDFAEYYRDAHEHIPHDRPTPRGLPVYMTAFVDASFAQNKKTRKSHTGFIIFVNRAPIVCWLLWCSHHTISVLQSTSNSLRVMHTFYNLINDLEQKGLY